MRAIIHFRIESFFASIETSRRPELVGKPVVVAKSTRSGGIVISASSEALALGVVNGMTIRHAQRVCPDATFISADYPLYKTISSAIMDVFSHYSPILEPDSLDKAWIDVTGSRKLFGGPKKMATEAIKTIEDIGYRAKAGIAVNKLVSSMISGSGRSKINLVAPGKETEVLSPLAVNLLPGVGEKTAKRFSDLGVKTIGQLASIPEKLILLQFGSAGERLLRLTKGIDHSSVKAAWPPEIITSEHMFQDALLEPAEVEEWLGIAANRLAIELRSCGRLTQTIELKINDSSAPAIWKLKNPVNQAGDILFALKRLLPMQMRTGIEVTGVSVILSDLTIGEGMQLSLLGSSERRRRMDRLIETLHDRFGDSSIVYAATISKSGRDTVIDRVAAA